MCQWFSPREVVGPRRWHVVSQRGTTSGTDRGLNHLYAMSSHYDQENLQDVVSVLTLLEGIYGIVIYCNASRAGLGCVLMQNGKVIAYAS
ncbi:hypothetical protein MTR67_031257 [Solanum verrucosum]|uniref:Uncharacterized protein n=1 Tax=Solanum verrucosum TaxID=315347 RepID=A0AAF0U267_SOLVR|nr:hypothetical protein MTR67_031257 [Solanum verrucosum]